MKGCRYRGNNYGKISSRIKEANVIGDLVLSSEEKQVLKNNPKLAILSQVDEETLDRELEVAGIKVRWDMRSNVEEYGIVEEEMMTKEKETEVEGIEEVSRQVFDIENEIMDFRG